MEFKTIVAIVLVVVIVGGFIFLQIRSKNKKWADYPRGGAKNSAPFLLPEGGIQWINRKRWKAVCFLSWRTVREQGSTIWSLLCTTTTAMQISCEPVNCPSVTLRSTTKATDFRVLKPSAGQGSVCSHFFLSIPVVPTMMTIALSLSVFPKLGGK